MNNILNFPAKEKIDADTVLQNSIGKLEDCIIIGVTKDDELYTAICAENAQQVVYLIRVLEHLLIAEDLT